MSSSIACSSSSNSIYRRSRESRNREASLYQTNGIKAIEAMQMSSPGFDNYRRLFITNSAVKFRRIKAMNSPTVTAQKREKDPKKRVVITGMGVVSVFGNDVDTFYSKLLDGVSGISPIDRFDASDYAVRFAGQIRNFSSEGYIDGEMDRALDDCWRYCLVSCKKAIDDANLSQQVLQTMNKKRIGVLMGTGYGGAAALARGIEAVQVRKEYKEVSPLCIPYTMNNMGSALLAIDTGFMGPNYSITTACSSSNHCFIAAANHIKRGDADIMVVGGTECNDKSCVK